ncbi:alginate export family protein [Nitrospira sp.]|nr:alginate export family protein [Nitrospira sp.]
MKGMAGYVRSLPGLLLGVALPWVVACEALAEESPSGPGDASAASEADSDFAFNLGHYQPSYGIYDEILDLTEPGPESLSEVLGMPSWLILGVTQRTRYESLQGRWRAGEAGSDQQLPLRTRLFFGIRDIWDPIRVSVELQDSRAYLTDSGSYVTTSSVNETDIQQLHVDVATKRILGWHQPSVLSVGRLNLDLGRRRWVARNNFRNTTQSFDGVHWRVGGEQQWQVRAFVTKPVEIRETQLDPIGSPNTLWGLYGESKLTNSLSLEGYYFGHRSRNAYRDFEMIGVRVYDPGGKGEWEFELESAYQFGDVSPQGRFENFQHVELGYTFDSMWEPQALLRFDYASGGLDPLYGARSFELTPSGIFQPFERSNIISPGVRGMVQPKERLTILAQYRAWWLADASAPWVGSGLQDPTGNSGRFLGQTIELRLRWGVIANVFLQVGYVHVAWGSYLERVPGGRDLSASDYGYVQTEFMF